MNDPLVSVVIPCFNGAEYLDECVRSVLAQNTDCEIIVVDDGSSDASVERAQALLSELAVPMLILSQKNRGPAAARNTGMRLARGKYLCFLDVDDRYAPGFLRSTTAILEKDPHVTAVSCAIELIDAHRPVEPWQREIMEYSQPGNVLMRTDVVRQIGGFPEHPAFRGPAAGEDATLRDELIRFGTVVKITRPLYQYRVRCGGHFDFFLDRTYQENGALKFRWLSPEENDDSVRRAVREYRQSVQDRMQAPALEKLQTSVAAGFEFERLAQSFALVGGFLHPAEGFTLYWLARRWPLEGTVVEIGSFKGRSTCWLAAGCRDRRGARLVAVDHFRGSPEHQPQASHADADVIMHGSTLPTFRRNLEEQKLTDWVTVHVGASAEVSKGWDGPIGLLFIDGNHSAEGVRGDFAAWAPFVAPRGLIVFHDVSIYPAVTQLYTELCLPGSGWKELARFHTLGILQRVGAGQADSTKVETEAIRPPEMPRRPPEQVDVLLRLARDLEGQEQPGENQPATEAAIVLKDCRYGKMLFLKHDQFVGKSLAHYGEYNEAEASLYAEYVGPGHVVVEVGANIGAHTVHLAKLVGPRGMVLAFEPQRVIFQLLCANIALNELFNVHAYQAAVAHECGMIKVPPLDYRGANNFGALSLLSVAEGDSVQVMTVDSFELPSLRLLKIDVEGAEFEVLLGARRNIARHRPILYVENNNRETSERLIALIEEMGYDMWWDTPLLFNPHNFSRCGDNVFPRVISANMLCIPKEADGNSPGRRRVSGPKDWWKPTAPKD